MAGDNGADYEDDGTGDSDEEMASDEESDTGGETWESDPDVEPEPWRDKLDC